MISSFTVFPADVAGNVSNLPPRLRKNMAQRDETTCRANYDAFINPDAVTSDSECVSVSPELWIELPPSPDPFQAALDALRPESPSVDAGNDADLDSDSEEEYLQPIVVLGDTIDLRTIFPYQAPAAAPSFDPFTSRKIRISKRVTPANLDSYLNHRPVVPKEDAALVLRLEGLRIADENEELVAEDAELVAEDAELVAEDAEQLPETIDPAVLIRDSEACYYTESDEEDDSGDEADLDIGSDNGDASDDDDDYDFAPEVDSGLALMNVWGDRLINKRAKLNEL